MIQQRLSGSVTVVRALAGHDLWFQEKFCRQAALMDLLLLANTREADAPARGGTRVAVGRGCLAWSIQALARRWQWSDVKVTGYLRELQQQGVVKVVSNTHGTLIRFVNYDTYNTPADDTGLAGDLATDLAGDLATEQATGLATDLAGDQATDLAQSRSRRKDKGKEGERENSPLPPKGAGDEGAELPSRDEVLAWCRTVAQGPIPDEFAAWRVADFDGRAIGWPRNWRRALLSDWLSPVRQAEFRRLLAKNGAEKPAAPVSASVRAIATRSELQSMQDDLDQLPEGAFRREQQARLDARWRQLEALEAGK